MEILLLRAALGALACWLVGLAAESRRWARHFQPNTERPRAVLSTIFVGRQLLTNLRFRLPRRELRRALQGLPLLVLRYVIAS